MERKHQRISLASSSILLVVLVFFAFWQTSLDFGEFSPSGPTATVVLWAISTLVVLGVVTLGFIVFRLLLRLYFERRDNRLGSRIKTKLVLGAFGLSIVPVLCLAWFSFMVLNRTLDKWFSQPTIQIQKSSEELVRQLREMMREKTENDAAWIASLPETAMLTAENPSTAEARLQLERLAEVINAHYVGLLRGAETKPWVEFRSGDLIEGPVERPVAAEDEPASEAGAVSSLDGKRIVAWAPLPGDHGGRVVVARRIPDDLLERSAEIEQQVRHYATLQRDHREYRYLYFGILALVTIFVLFVATWLALFLSKQIIVPIEALVEATGELSSGHLDHRVQTRASDELGALVQSFNRMTQQLESHRRKLEQSNAHLARANTELDARRSFIDAILESITPGVMSVSDDGEIQKINSSLNAIFPRDNVEQAQRLEDLFSSEDHDELRYMMKRARRTGLANREFVFQNRGRILHASVTVSALEKEAVDPETPGGFVIVVEDTTELLRAQKSEAWTEVARRVAHEIKNPLTPIALSAERMSRLVDRFGMTDDPTRRRELEESLDKCTSTIVREVGTLGKLVNEFAQFARLPAAQPREADLNTVVADALDVFEGRLEGIHIEKDLGVDLPAVFIDPEQFRRVLVNLIDNAAAAIEESPVREISIHTAAGLDSEHVQVIVADSGHGISPEDKEKLFLPYFSTKRRGTGLGLAIVNRILSEHHAAIRVEDRRPTGSRFIVEVPTAASRVAAPVGVQA